jgi:hypothetical protein
MSKRRWVTVVLALTIMGFALAMPAYSQQDLPHRVPPPLRGGEAGPVVITDQIGTTSFAGLPVYTQQVQYGWTRHRLNASQSTSQQTFVTDTVTLWNNFSADNGQFHCEVHVDKGGLVGQAKIDVYLNGKRVIRGKGTWKDNVTYSNAAASFNRPELKASAGDEVKCVVKIVKKNSVTLPNNTIVSTYVFFSDSWDIT